ncbi:MAG: ceramide glucosyltransferase, partial [Paracoccaceae bacterium]
PFALAFSALALLGADLTFGVVYVVIWYSAEVFLAKRAGWPMGVSGLLMLMVRDLMLPVIWLATFLHRGVDWRGTTLTAKPAAPAMAAE